MRLLVLTPTLGNSPWLEEVVTSVKNHAEGCRHVLVAARDCGDLSGFGVSTIPDPGGGMYAAINEGLRAVADWDAFTYINDDDLLDPGFGAAVDRAEEFTRLGRAALIYGGVALINSAGRRLGRVPISRFPRFNRMLYAERLEPVYQHGTVVTRAAWEQHGGFDESFRYCGDSEYLARLCIRGVPAVRVGATVAAFRLRKGQLTKNRAAMVAERRRVDEKLGLLAGPSRRQRLFARWVFRLANAPVYAERVARHGFLSFDEVLERAG